MQGVPPLLKVATWLSAGICIGMQMPADIVWWPWMLATLAIALPLGRCGRLQSGCLVACVVLMGACITAWQRQSLRFPFTDKMERIEAVEPCRPWRSYAVICLWNSLGNEAPKPKGEQPSC